MHSPLDTIEHSHAKILVCALFAKCHKATLTMKPLVISVTYHTSQNRVSDTILHV